MTKNDEIIISAASEIIKNARKRDWFGNALPITGLRDSKYDYTVTIVRTPRS